MERSRRRVWTFAITVGAVLVIGAALASGLFQLAMLAVPGYRAEIENYVKDVTGRPVRIGALNLAWRFYYPALELRQVALLDPDGGAILEVERLRLGFGPMRLIRGDFNPTRLELNGLVLDARFDRDGQLKIAGFEQPAGAGDEPEFRDLLPRLEQFDQLQLERCRLNLGDERRQETWSFGIVKAEVARGMLGAKFDADIVLPASLGESAKLDASISGDWSEPATWSGYWGIKADGIAAGSWLSPFLARGAHLELSGAEAILRGQFEDGHTTAADLWLRTGPVNGRRAQHMAALKSLEAKLTWERKDGGWSARLEKFKLDSVNGSWPATQAQVQYSHGEQGGLPAVEGKFEFIRLADLTPWLQIVRKPGSLATLDRLAGELRDVQFKIQSADADDLRYSVQAHFEELALPAIDRAAGFSGARGELAADESGGRAIFSEAPIIFELPGALISQNVLFESLQGEIEWRRQSDGWTFHSPRFAWRLLSTRGNGRLELLLPDGARRSPEIKLNMQFSADDVTKAKSLMPRHWSADLRHWLDRSIVSGRAESAELNIAGRLADFPFADKPGVFKLDIQARNVLLAYQPDWPPVENLSAMLRFRGNSLTIGGVSGVIGGNTIKTAVARFPDISTGELGIDGTVEGETARFYEFLSRSPLRKPLATLLRETTAGGPASVTVNLKIPLSNVDDTEVRGVVSLDGIVLRHASLPEPVKDIEGRVSFSSKGIASERLSGSLFGQTLVASITPKLDSSSLLSANLIFAPGSGKSASQNLSSFVPAWLLRKLDGTSDWRAELVIAGDDTAPVKLSSNLIGLAVRLPPPLGKTAAQAVPMVLTMGANPQAPLRITADYRDRFNADLNFSRRGNAVHLTSGAVRLGAGPAIGAPASGVILGGVLPELDLRQWADELAGSGLEQQASLFRSADLNIGRARWGGLSIGETRYQWLPQRPAKGGSWRIEISGAGGAGELRWNPQNRGLLTARLDSLALNHEVAANVAATTTPLAADEEIITDPNLLPRFDLDVRRLSVNQTDFGAVALTTARTEFGQSIRALKVAGGLLNLSGAGEWRRRAGLSSATLNFDFGSSNISALLRALNYTPTLEAKSSTAKGTLRWMPAAKGIQWQQAQGTVSINFVDGQLRAVKPGVGRVLGLFNFYALPRRLTLNFKDVLGSGLGFDQIQGDFALAEGNAHTENLQIVGPSLRMDVRGRVGLAARDYDQSVTVYPDMSAGVTLGALALGGPVAGVLALIAQELLNKPLDQVSQLSYRVTGSWDDPQVERAADPEPATERRSGPASQNP